MDHSAREVRAGPEWRDQRRPGVDKSEKAQIRGAGVFRSEGAEVRGGSLGSEIPMLTVAEFWGPCGAFEKVFLCGLRECSL